MIQYPPYHVSGSRYEPKSALKTPPSSEEPGASWKAWIPKKLDKRLLFFGEQMVQLSKITGNMLGE